MHLLKLSTEDIAVITTEEAKAQSSVFVDEDDAYIDTLVEQALEQVAKDTRRTLIDTQWQLTLCRFEPIIQLKKPPVIEIVSIAYVDTQGVEQTIDPASCQLSVSDVGAWLLPGVGEFWPAVQAGNQSAVTIIYRAGYVKKVGETAEGKLPASLRHAALVWSAHLYDMREAYSTVATHEVPAYGCMIAPYEVDLI